MNCTGMEVRDMIKDKVAEVLIQAEEIWPDHMKNYPFPQIRFNIRGLKLFGQARSNNILRFNPKVMMIDPKKYCQQVVPHEVAHLITDYLNKHRRWQIKPHGSEWRQVMICLGEEPSRTIKGIDVSSLKKT